MWVCQNCGTSDETEDLFDEELDSETGDTIRYCPECGSDEVVEVDEDDHDPEGLRRDYAGYYGYDGEEE